ncbi:MAG: DUF1573 domain-containing protein [Bacteroidota bacterium]
MYRTVFLLVTLVLFSCSQKSTKENNQDKSPLPIEKTEIVFRETMHNFGELKAGEIVVVTFQFTNNGPTDYIIENINSGCGCIKTEFSKQPVKQGNSGLIEIEFDSSGLFGKQLKTIEIYGNSKELKHLVIFAEVKNEQLEINY